jgi:4-diphosphocytidyl-2-C-methyl-D-erythritol kinase
VSREAKTKMVDAPAKVNLFLRVLGLRPDGYHELETLILPVSLADRLEVHADSDPSFRTLSFSLDVSGDPELVRGVPRDETNLVVRAGMALAERAGVRGFADVSLEKRIPSAAGLGGGSSDAAAALVVLNELWACGLDAEALRDVGASVGSDVPALMAGGPVLARGRGERVERAPVGPLSLALVTFPFGVSTPDAFRWWDEAGGPVGPDPGALPESARYQDEGFGASLFNDLEGPVIRRHPEIGEAKRAMLEGGALGALMTGSGPTVFGLLADPDARLDPSAEREIEAVAGRPPAYVTAKGSNV